jgi:hypothetical protein
VDNVIVTTDDHDFVDLTITPPTPAPTSGKTTGWLTRLATTLTATTATLAHGIEGTTVARRSIGRCGP